MKKILSTLALICLLCPGLAQFSAFADEITAETGSLASDNYFEDDYGDNESYTPYNDIFSAWNKPWHSINDFALIKVAKPLHEKYSQITTPEVRSGFSAFLENHKTPKRMVNALLQGEVGQFFVELGRFIVNTTTSLGFADVASINNKPLVPYTPENLRFGYTLATWGFGEGSYFVYPFFGPSTVREAIGTSVDFFSNAFDYLVPWYVFTPGEVFLAFNEADKMYVPYETVTSNALDPYIALRNAYLENLYSTRPIVSKPKK